jgi:hypothetical protein
MGRIELKGICFSAKAPGALSFIVDSVVAKCGCLWESGVAMQQRGDVITRRATQSSYLSSYHRFLF